MGNFIPAPASSEPPAVLKYASTIMMVLPDVSIRIVYLVINQTIEIMRAARIDGKDALNLDFNVPSTMLMECSTSNTSAIAQLLFNICIESETVDLHDNFAGSTVSYTNAQMRANLMADIRTRLAMLVCISFTTTKIKCSKVKLI